MEDSDLIKLILCDCDNDALEQLMEKHSGVFVQTINKYAPYNLSKYDKGLLFEEKPSIFFDAISSYDEERCQFVTWLANRTKFYCLSKRSLEKKYSVFCEFEENLGGETDLTPDSYLDKKTKSAEILNLIENQFGKETRIIFEERYFGGTGHVGKTFSEISQEIGVTPQAIQAKHKKVLKFLKNKLK